MSVYLLAAVLGYAIGSLPSAYLLVKWKARLDIRTAGSGNVGTLNSYEVTRSKLVGASVLILDVVKGVAAVVAGRLLGDEFTSAAVAALGAVLGHNFPVWLSFRGGRGLATAAGAMLLLGWVILPIWMAVWFIGYKLSRDVNVGNAGATGLMSCLPLVLPDEVVSRWMPHNATAASFRWYLLLLGLLILLRLIGPVKAYFAEKAMKASASKL